MKDYKDDFIEDDDFVPDDGTDNTSTTPVEPKELSTIAALKRVLPSAGPILRASIEKILEKHPLVTTGKFIAKNPAAAGATALTLAAPPVGLGASVGLAALGGASGEAYRRVLSGQSLRETPGQAAKGVAKAGAVEGVTQAASGGTGAALSKLTKMGPKALGFVKRLSKTPQQRKVADGAVKEIGGEVIKPLRSVQGMIDKTNEIGKESGENIGKFLDDMGVGFDSKSAIQKLEELRPREGEIVLQGGKYTAQNTVIDEAIATIKAHGDGPLKFKAMNKVKGIFQKAANYSRSAKTPTEELDKAVAGTFMDFLDESLDSVSQAAGKTADFAKFIVNKKRYKSAQTALVGLDDRMAKMGNRLIGLTDVITGVGTGGAALASGNGLTSLAIAGGTVFLKKVADKYGAQTAFSIGKAIEKNPNLLPALARTLKISISNENE